MADQSVQVNNINTELASTNSGTIQSSNNNSGNWTTKINNKNKKKNSFKVLNKQRYPAHYERTNQYNNNRGAISRFGYDDGNISDYHRCYGQELYWRKPSRHTVKQRRWRARRKHKPHSIELSLSHTTVQQPIEQNINLSSDTESFEDNFINDENGNFEDDSINDENDNFEDNFINDEADYNIDLNSGFVELTEQMVQQEVDEPLYNGASITFRCYHKQILEFGNLVKLNDSNMSKLLKLIDNALPIGNKLVKSNKKLVSIFQEHSSFTKVLKCTKCLEIVNNNNCCSITCEQNQTQRRVGDIIEHLSVGRSNKQLIEIIRRNKQLILNYPQLVEKLLPCDVMTRLVYHKKKKNLQTISNNMFPITLMLHIDSTPIVHWTKKHTWLVTASIVEIPPPLRENQFNLLLLSLWNGPVKPDADSLLNEVCDTIKQTLIVDGIKFSVDILLFKADLPARALATKHVHHNGYYACLECDQEVNLRTSTSIGICAKLVSQKTSDNNCYGVKGVSPLAKVLEIPTQIDLDAMHLCFIGHCSLLLSKWEKIIVKEAWYSAGPSSSHVRDSRSNIHQPINQPLSSMHNSITSNHNNYVAPVTSTEIPVKKRRPAASTLVAPSTAPLPRKRFNPAVQNTAAAMMSNLSGGENTLNSRTVNPPTRSISETTQNSYLYDRYFLCSIINLISVLGFNQILKPLMKLCEETNQLVKEMLKQMTEQTQLIKESLSSPRELQKTAQQLSQIVRMELNGINLGHVSRGPSLNITARSLVRAAYGEKASFNDLAPGEFDLLLGFLARIHQLNVSSVLTESQSIKNSLQQMKHDEKKRKFSLRSSITLSNQGTSTAGQPLSSLSNDEDDDNDNEI
ncbi:unnamed protein product [Rotaria sp. Silwood2]|nr:unnamed protein product [Rotaria sp. Silwood2]CAF3364954.1 unnamed protein product [Rotaria sp. Silwood2]